MANPRDEAEARDSLAFLHAKLADAERMARARDEMAAVCEREMTPAEWEAAMALHPSTRGTPMPTPEKRREDAALQRHIGDKYRHEARMYHAVIAALSSARVACREEGIARAVKLVEELAVEWQDEYPRPDFAALIATIRALATEE